MLLKDNTSRFFAAIAFLVVGIAIVGGIKSFSTIPYGDMWYSYINVTDDFWSHLWDLNNEHRLVLSHFLYWFDVTWFGGLSIFLIIVNYLLVTISACFFLHALNLITHNKEHLKGKIALSCFLVAWLFSWCQHENLMTGFNTQVFLAQIVPLFAFYWTHKAAMAPQSAKPFILACLLGFASIGAMANGVLVLPMMLVYALLTRQSTARLGTLLLLSILTPALYFHGLTLNHPDHSYSFLNFAHYLLLYLGGPFYRLLGHGEFGQQVAIAGGAILLINAAWFFVQYCLQPKNKSLQLTLILFIGYVIATGIITASGRIMLGHHQALTSRYTTGVLMAWAALLVLHAPLILNAANKTLRYYLLPLGIIGILLVVSQFKAFHAHVEKHFNQRLAVLALELQINDPIALEALDANTDNILVVAKRALDKKRSIYHTYPFNEVRNGIGTHYSQKNIATCQGQLNTITSIPDQTRYKKISGWMFNENNDTQPALIRIVDNTDKIVGFALTGNPQKKTATKLSNAEQLSGFEGYMLTPSTAKPFALIGDQHSCKMTVSA